MHYMMLIDFKQAKPRWRFERESSYRQSFGIAVLASGGCNGSTYGEPGLNMGQEVQLVLGPLSLTLIVVWKKFSGDHR